MKIVRLTRTRTRSLDIAIAATEVAGTQGDGEAGFGRTSSGLVESRAIALLLHHPPSPISPWISSQRVSLYCSELFLELLKAFLQSPTMSWRSRSSTRCVHWLYSSYRRCTYFPSIQNDSRPLYWRPPRSRLYLSVLSRSYRHY